MNKIDKIKIEGFWGDKSIEIKFNSDVNFFIGVNGSGKTTVINLIAAALSADFPTLERLSFKMIHIKLSEIGGTKKPVIEVKKNQSKRLSYQHIKYYIKEMASEKFQVYSLDEYEEKILIRRQMKRRQLITIPERKETGVSSKLKTIINTSWLSIHRSNSQNGLQEESYESSVDKKLDELSSEIGKYLSILSAKISEETEKFQKNIIFSLLTGQTQDQVLSAVKELNLKEERKALEEIFKKLDLNNKKELKALDKLFIGVEEALSKYNLNQRVTINELDSLFTLFRSHRVVESWKSLLKEQEKILSPKTTFLKVLNSLFQEKRILINDKNEIVAITKSDKTLSVNELSSGEKQLIIILGEALLQESTPWVYIADEPELSLHVSWQEKLIGNLKLLNPESQIICATHSPDIISSFSKNVFDLKDFIK